MQFDLVVRNGTVVTARESFRADVGVRDGRIAAVGDLRGAQSAETYDAAGKFVFPGFIDEHVHSRDPGLTQKEDFAHSTLAAAAGGITTVLEMPNSVPPVTDAASFRSRAEALQPKAFVDFALWGMMLGDVNREALPALAEAGVIGFKFFWGYALNPKTLALVYNFKKTDDVVLPPDEGQIYESFRTIAQTGKPVAVHAENSDIISRLAARESAGGANDYAAFLRSRPSFTEALTTQTAIAIAAAAGAHLHVLHVTAGDAVDLIAQARARGQAVTAETCPHYLTVTDEDFGRLGVHMKVYPPVRERQHQERLWLGVQRGELQAIGSDHAPHEEREKVGTIWQAPAGACAIQEMATVILDHASRGKLTLNQVAALLSENPARIWGLYGKKGAIQPGADADLTVVDMERRVTIRREDLLSKNKITMYDGMTFQGVPVAAFVRGSQVMDQGRPLGSPRGQLVKPVGPAQARW